MRTWLLKLHRSNRRFDLSVCIFFARQMESDMSIYFMLPTDRIFKDEQSKSRLFLAHHSSKWQVNISTCSYQFSYILTCQFAFDEAKQNETAQMKKMMWWPVNTAALFSQVSVIDNILSFRPK